MNNDTNQTRPADAKPSLLSRPTLASSDADAPDGWEDSRILSNSKMGPLTKNPPKKRPSPADNRARAKASAVGTGFKTLAAVSVLCVGSFLVYQYVSEIQHNARVAKEQANAAAAAAAQIAANALALPPVSATAEPGDEPPLVLAGTEQAPAQTAQIIDEPLPQSAPTALPAAPAQPQAQGQAPAPASDGQLTTALENGVRPPPATLEKALQPSAPVSPQGSAPATARPTQQAKARPAAPAKVAPPKPPVAVATAPIPPTVAAEKDVNLLAALVAHNSANATKPSSPKPSAPRTDTNATDAAQRAPEESADALLKRCAALEPERQAACRLKACSGARASEPACKTTPASSPVPGAPAVTPEPAPAPAPAPAPVAAPAVAAPAAPALPSVPALPAQSAQPALPAIPGLPALPAIPFLSPAQ